jgi:hypothetical protein
MLDQQHIVLLDHQVMTMTMTSASTRAHASPLVARVDTRDRIDNEDDEQLSRIIVAVSLLSFITERDMNWFARIT